MCVCVCVCVCVRVCVRVENRIDLIHNLVKEINEKWDTKDMALCAVFADEASWRQKKYSVVHCDELRVVVTVSPKAIRDRGTSPTLSFTFFIIIDVISLILS